MGDNTTESCVYACRQHSGFSFKGIDRWFRFEKHQLILDKAEDIADLDMHIEKYPNIGNKVKKVSLEQAEALVAQHVRDHGGAAKGPFTAAHGNQGDLNAIQNRDAALSALRPDQEAELRNKLAKDSELLTTSKVETLEKPKSAIQPKIKLQAKS